MNYWQTVALVVAIAFFGSRGGDLLYWRIHKKHLGEPKPTWRYARGQAWSAFLASCVALALYGK